MSFFPSEGNGGIFAQGAFTIDPNSTPEMIQAKRAQLAALMPQYGRAKYVGEGIGQLATGIATGRKNKALDKFEGERRQEAAGAFNNLMTGQGSATPRSSGPLSILGLRAPEQNANDAKYPVGQEGPAPQGNIDPASGLNMGQEVGGYRQSLIGTESGGNWAAQNSEMGAGGKPGHFGRVQFGQARLQDAMNAGAIPQGVTPEQFMASPELQMAAEDWHFADLENQLGDLVGSRVNGQVLDMGALVAMGHLGGAGGARKFVESGGRYNPSDAYGTSLADYANTHGGGGSFAPGAGTQVAQAGGPALNDLMMAAQNPWLTPQQKSVINSQIEQVQRQQTRAQDRQWEQQDPLYQLRLQQAQLNLEQDRAGTGANMPSAVQELQWRAQQAGLEPGTAEYQTFILNGSGDPSTFRALDMQAQAAGFEPGTPEYADFMATRGSGLQAGASQTAKNNANIQTGGQAAAAVAAGTATGKANAEAAIAADSDMQAGANALDLIQSIRNDPARKIGTGKTAMLGAIPGTAAYDFKLKVDQAKSGAFMTAIQQMRGMGALSNAEGQTATAAVTRMNTSMTEEGFLAALDDYEKVIRQGIAKAERNGGSIAGPAPSAQSGDIPPLPQGLADRGVTADRWPTVWNGLSDQAKAHYRSLGQ